MPAPAREKIWLGKRNNTDKSLMTDLGLKKGIKESFVR